MAAHAVLTQRAMYEPDASYIALALARLDGGGSAALRRAGTAAGPAIDSVSPHGEPPPMTGLRNVLNYLSPSNTRVCWPGT